MLKFVLLKTPTKKELEKQALASSLDSLLRKILYNHLDAIETRADTMSGYELCGYECPDPEELLTDIYYFIEVNFQWRKKPNLNQNPELLGEGE